jgi:hypothetical protein
MRQIRSPFGPTRSGPVEPQAGGHPGHPDNQRPRSGLSRARLALLRPRRSPLSGVDECSCRLAEPLCDPHREVHVRETSRSQIRQPARRAVEFVRQLRPREIALAALLVERCMSLLQVPSKPAISPCLRQCHIAHVDNLTCQEVLRRTAKPPQHEQRILAGGCPSLCQSRDRSSAQWMICSLCVEFRRLLPQFVGEGTPVQPTVTTLGVQCVEERAAVENRQPSHSRERNREQAVRRRPQERGVDRIFPCL